MKTVLILISSLGGGGAERVTVRLASALSEDCRVWVVPFSRAKHPYPMSPAVRVADLSLYDLRDRSGGLPARLFRKGRSVLHSAPRLRALRKKIRPDVTLSLLLEPNLLNLATGRRERRVVSERNNPKRKGRLHFLLSALVCSRADAVVFQSENVRSMFPACVRKKGAVVPNPVNVSCRADAEREKEIVNFGRLSGQKNQALLLRAFSRFHETHPEYRLRIFGDGPLRDALEEQITALGLTRCAVLEGFREDIHEAVRRAEFFVLSSDYEGQPNALLEAMQMGLPCITTDWPGAGELLEDGQTVRMVPAGDEAALAAAMTEFAEDPALRARLGRQGQAFAEGFAPERILPLWKAVLFGETRGGETDR